VAIHRRVVFNYDYITFDTQGYRIKWVGTPDGLSPKHHQRDKLIVYVVEQFEIDGNISQLLVYSERCVSNETFLGVALPPKREYPSHLLDYGDDTH
jgi:hypothetical protein